MTYLFLLVGFCAPLVLLGPLLDRITQRVVFKRPAPATAAPKGQVAVVRAFQPLDLGPDLVRWPSEIPRTILHFPEPPWPSEGWNDEHFGRKRKATAPRPVLVPEEPAPAPKQGIVRPAPPPPVEASRAEKAFFEVAPASKSPQGLAGLTDDQIRGLVEKEGLVKSVELLVERAELDAGTVARELRRILSATARR